MFEPMNKGHAISEAVFSFEFENLPTATLNTMLGAHSKIAEFLPRKDPMPGMMFEQSSGGFSMSQVPGEEWKHFKADGNPDWTVRISPNSVSVHCMEYTRWTEIWPQAFEILSHIFGAVDDKTVHVLNIGLRYVDRFDFKGGVDSYDVGELIREKTPHVAEKVLADGTRWHSYTGWFEKSDTLDREVLQQLNVDAVIQIETNLPVVSITHTSQLRATIPDEIDSYRHFTHIADSPIAIFMAVAHDNNHRLLRELLTDNMLDVISLGD